MSNLSPPADHIRTPAARKNAMGVEGQKFFRLAPTHTHTELGYDKVTGRGRVVVKWAATQLSYEGGDQGPDSSEAQNSDAT